MRARLIYRERLWWCFRMGVTGCGPTPKDAYDDMWTLYLEFIAKANRQQAEHQGRPVRA